MTPIDTARLHLLEALETALEANSAIGHNGTKSVERSQDTRVKHGVITTRGDGPTIEDCKTNGEAKDISFGATTQVVITVGNCTGDESTHPYDNGRVSMKLITRTPINQELEAVGINTSRALQSSDEVAYVECTLREIAERAELTSAAGRWKHDPAHKNNLLFLAPAPGTYEPAVDLAPEINGSSQSEAIIYFNTADRDAVLNAIKELLAAHKQQMSDTERSPTTHADMLSSLPSIWDILERQSDNRRSNDESAGSSHGRGPDSSPSRSR